MKNQSIFLSSCFLLFVLFSCQTVSKRNAVSTYIATPISVTGKLLSLCFHSDSAIDSNDNYSPPDVWFLLMCGDEKEEQFASDGTVFFDLGEKYEVSEDVAKQPEKAGYGIYRSVFLEFTLFDLEFEFDNKFFALRICTSDRDGCTRGDLMMRDVDGNFKWISKGGDPDTLLSFRPEDPVADSKLASWASGWATGDSTATIFATEAHIPRKNRFDVPSITGSYSITLDFDLTNVVMLKDIDTANYTKRDILEKLEIFNFVGRGRKNHLVVIPTVLYLGD